MTTDRDPGRRRRIAIAAAAICLIAAVLLYLWRPRVALGFVGGVITGAGMLSVLVLVLNRIVVPQKERRYSPAVWAVLYVGKFVAAAAFAYLIVHVLGGDVVAFAGGYTLALAVLFVMLLGEKSPHARGAAQTDESSEDEAKDAHDAVTL